MRRGGSRRLRTAGWVLIGVLAMPVAGNAADIFVNTTADTNDGLCIPPFGCSLRDAVMIANSNPGKDTIHLPVGVYSLTISGPGGAEEGDLDISDDVDIEGSGASVTVIDGLSDDNVFHIPLVGALGYPLLQLFDLTIAGGSTGVLIQDASLYLWRCVVKGTSLGGVNGTSSTILIVDSVIRENGSAGGFGGGRIGGADGSLWVLRSTIADNMGDEFGGASCSVDASATFTNATITGNSSFNGTSGGFDALGCDVLITGSTLAGNLQNDLDLGVHPTIRSTVTVRNTYIGSQCPLGTANQVTSEGGNVGGNNCGLNHASDIDFAGGTAILLPLGDYGGYTPTMPPFGVGYNPLVDNPGADPNCLTEDQRGISRPQDGGGVTIACDTGAVERTHIFVDDFESGDTSAWSSKVE